MIKLLDLYCGAGGAAVGYHRAGILEITGIDIKPQPNYPYRFIQSDAIKYLLAHGHEYDLIHASPPCHGYSVLKGLAKKKPVYLIDETRNILISVGKPYVIENVPGAPLKNYVMLCGTMFGLPFLRHRLFETNPLIVFSPMVCAHDSRKSTGLGMGEYDRGQYGYISITGHGFSREAAARAMQIDWSATRDEIAQMIPPIYTEYIGRIMITIIGGKNETQS